MIHLLADYIFSDSLRYEGHKLIYAPAGSNPIELSGILAASIAAALLSVTDEGEARGITLDTPGGRNDFFVRYEKEVLADNGGLLNTEVQALNEAYLEFAGEEGLLLRICRNERLLDLALGLMVEYMQRLVREEVCEQIYVAVPWTMPFAQWLFNAGFVETRRQYLLSIDWTDPASVYALSEELSADANPQTTNPTFIFNDLSAEQLLNAYWDWLWNKVQNEANLYPDSKVKLAEYKKLILENETTYDFLKPEMKDFTPEELNLFRNWMNQWTAFVEQKVNPVPATKQKKDIRQEIFLDEVMTVPPARNYVKVREYIIERCKYDSEFKKYYKAHKRTDFCRQLSLLFDWYVDPNALGKRMKSKAKK